MDKLTIRQIKRIRGVNLFRVLSAAQFILGFLLVFFAGYSVTYHTDSIRTTVPYYTGAFITGPVMLILSISGGAVFHRGYKAKTELRAMTEPKLAMIIYICLCPIAISSSIVGAILTSTYGFCAQESYCSYTINNGFNIGMAILLFVLETFSFFTCICSFIMIWKYAKLLGVTCAKYGSDISKVRPGASELASINEAADEYHMKKWQEKVVDDVNFGRIREYRAASRAGEYLNDASLAQLKSNNAVKIVAKPRRESTLKSKR